MEKAGTQIFKLTGIPGLGVKEGDYLMAVNGQSLKAPMNPYQLFEQTAGQTTQISVSSDPKQAAQAKDILVVPVRSEYPLRTADWIEGNRRKVDELSGGKLAYVYVPNTGGGGLPLLTVIILPSRIKKESSLTSVIMVEVLQQII